MTTRKPLAVGIIAEYNPFHNGHKFHLQQSLEQTNAEVAVAVISGNFTQRGSLAILDKWSRAEMAVRNGVNLVVEMPALFACNNAGYFARGGVEILENLGCDYISFGSESGNMDELQQISREMTRNRRQMNERIQAAVKEGIAYPRARREAMAAILEGSGAGALGTDAFDTGSAGFTAAELDRCLEILDSPNNLLALEYLRFMRTAEPVTVKRQGTGYYDLEPKGGMASATGIRRMLAAGEDISRLVPEVSREMLDRSEEVLAGEEHLFPLLQTRILTTPAEELNRIFGAEEGLGNKLKNNIRYWHSYEEMADGLKSKRYTRTRIGRLLAMILLGITREDVKAAKTYIRVLAFDERGSAYLKEVKKSGICELPIVTNINKLPEDIISEETRRTLEKDVLAADLYNLAVGKDLYKHSDFVKKPLKLERVSCKML